MDIRQMPRDEKLAVIREYGERYCYNYERDELARYLWAVYRNRTKDIGYFEQFGSFVRQIVSNVRTYERGLKAFGITEKRYNGSGWLSTLLPVVFSINISDRGIDDIRIGKGANGMFAYAVSTFSSSHCVCVWDEPIADFNVALKTAILELEKVYTERLAESRRDPINNPKKLINNTLTKIRQLKQQYCAPKQLEMF